jgi:predicted oxidoreductase
MRYSVVVTGGGRGIGRKIAERLLANPECSVVVIEFDAASLDWMNGQSRLIPVVGDASDVEVAEKAVRLAAERGTLTGWVNNAAVLPELRNRMQLVTKFGLVKPSANRPRNKTRHYNTSKEHILRTVERSLRNFGTDHIDLLLIHRPDPFMDPEQVAEAFDTLRSSGKVRYFGVSNFKFHQFNMLQSYLNVRLVTNQIELSAYRLENFEDGTLNFCMEKRIPPMAWSPLAKGRIFTDQHERAIRLRDTLHRVAAEIGADRIDEVLYAWLLNHPANIMPVIGTGKKERIDQAVRACGHRLTLDQWFEIYQSSTGHPVP